MRTKLKGDDDYDSLEDIEVCFSCSSVDGNNPDCERQDGTFSIDLINTIACTASDNYCGLVISEQNNVTVFQVFSELILKLFTC